MSPKKRKSYDRYPVPGCPICGKPTTVEETRGVEGGLVVRRRRRCFNNHKFTTYEKFTEDQPAEKSDFRKEDLDDIETVRSAIVRLHTRLNNK